MEITKRESFIIQLAQISRQAKKAFMKDSAIEITKFHRFNALETYCKNPVNFDAYLF